MSDKNNDSIDNLSEQYTESESESKAYIKAQSATIISQSREMNVLKKQKEQLEDEVRKLSLEVVQLKANSTLTSGQSFQVSDEETVSVIQIAMLRQIAMNRELTLEEAKKFELFAKVLQTIRGKVVKKEEETAGKLSNEELLKAMSGMLNEPQ